jgi:hypothetical protein
VNLNFSFDISQEKAAFEKRSISFLINEISRNICTYVCALRQQRSKLYIYNRLREKITLPFFVLRVGG